MLKVQDCLVRLSVNKIAKKFLKLCLKLCSNLTNYFGLPKNILKTSNYLKINEF